MDLHFLAVCTSLAARNQDSNHGTGSHGNSQFYTSFPFVGSAKAGADVYSVLVVGDFSEHLEAAVFCST
jgi:hypothetical protein